MGLVTISGGQKPAVRVQANPSALASLGLSLEDLRTGLAAANTDQAKGNLQGPQQSFTIGANDQIFTSEDYKPVIIAYRDGVHTLATLCPSVKRSPARASRSQLGVFTFVAP